MTRIPCLALAAIVAGCSAAPAPADPPTPAPRSYSTLAQLMRGIPFPNSNIVFDTQTTDPGAKRDPAEAPRGGATADFGNVYGGWQAVENSALAVAETATLVMVPGRSCENGRPVPIDREDYRRFASQLADAGLAAYKAAQSRNLDAMVEVSGTVSDACAACHEVYRDKEDPKERCIP